MLPLPSRTHPKNQTPVVYTEKLTHLSVAAIDDPARTYTQDPLKVVYKYSGLQRSARCKVRVLYFGEHRVQKALVNGMEY